MFEVRLTEIDGRVDDFKELVNSHIERLIAFNKEVGKPRPVAPPIVEACVKRNQTKGQSDSYEACYQIIDDTPIVQALGLEDRKAQLHSTLGRAEVEAKDKVTPPRKRRLAEMTYQVAISKPEAERTDEDKTTIEAFLEINRKWVALSLIAAQAESDIEDLTEDNVESWQLPTFEI